MNGGITNMSLVEFCSAYDESQACSQQLQDLKKRKWQRCSRSCWAWAQTADYNCHQCKVWGHYALRKLVNTERIILKEASKTNAFLGSPRVHWKCNNPERCKTTFLRGDREERSLQMLLWLTEQMKIPAWFTSDQPLITIHTIDYR